MVFQVVSSRLQLLWSQVIIYPLAHKIFSDLVKLNLSCCTTIWHHLSVIQSVNLVLVSVEKIYQTFNTVFDRKHLGDRQKFSAARRILEMWSNADFRT